MAWHGWRDLFCYGIRHRRCAILGLPKKLQEKKVMRKVLLLLVFVVAGAPVFAQVAGAKAASQAKTTEETFAPDAATHNQVMTLLDLLQIRKTMATMMDGMKQAMKQGAER